MTELKISDYEFMLGPADKFVMNFTHREPIRKWLVLKGHDPHSVGQYSTIQLANLYHELGPQSKAQQPEQVVPSIEQKEAAEIVLRTVMAMQGGLSAVEAIHSIIRQEIPTDETLRRLAKEVYDDLPARKLEIVTPSGSVMLTGRRHCMTETVLRVCGLGHNIMLVGPAGAGKTTIGENVAHALQLPFYITPTVQDTHELIGFIDGYGKYKATSFRHAFQNGGVWVADEIDAWDASTLLVANSALANGYTTFPDAELPIRKHPNFRVIATANTFGTGADRVYVGRNELDAASLDRFAVIEVDYDLELERLFSNGNPRWLERVWHVRKRVQEKKIRHVVSSRAIIYGSQALQAGIIQDSVESMYLFKGMSSADREKVR